MKLAQRLCSFSIIAAAFGLGVPTPAIAQEAVLLKGDVQIERTVSESGTTTTFLEDPASVVPGDRLLFTTSYKNQSDDAVEDFVVTNPLPEAIALAETGADFDVSVDGGATFGPLPELSVQSDEGSVRQATLSDVTHVRWVLERLEAGATGTLGYYATVR